MKIETISDLKECIQACRKLGVERIKIGDVEFHLGSPPVKAKRQPKGLQKQLNVISESDKIDMPDELTEEQLLAWSIKEA